jgi:hypothetical protein
MVRSEAGGAVPTLLLLLMATPVAAQTVAATPASGHPNVAVTATGSGFADNEAIDVYVDTTDTLLLVSTSTGTFSGSLNIPAAAQPGTHYVTAIGRRSGDAAQTVYKVTTPWAELGLGAAGRAWNAWENTLSTGTVPQLGLLWEVPTDTVISSPTVTGGHAYVATQAGIEALTTTTGVAAWQKLTTTQFFGTPVVSGSALYIGSAKKPCMS